MRAEGQGGGQTHIDRARGVSRQDIAEGHADRAMIGRTGRRGQGSVNGAGNKPMPGDNIRDDIRDDIPDPLQTVADLRRQLAQCRAERDEALARETATGEVLAVINSSPGELAPVFDAILEKAHLLCGATKGALAIYDGEQFRAVATRGLSETFANLIGEPQGNTPGGPNHRLLSGESILHIADISAVPGRIPQAAAELEGARTVLFVPLRKDRALLGYVTAYRQECGRSRTSRSRCCKTSRRRR